MGQVYQATDTQLNRQVALKILPDAFAGDPDRLARFQREAQVLASLNHPNIAQIHGIEEAEGTRALVLELVEGPTLADRIATGPIPLDEALPIAKQIAEALEAAHEAGVIHRDLKPANIKVREDGTVKVLDFGLAKALNVAPDGDPSHSPTLTAAATQMGVIMGTAAYMSPEQARGKPVDKRTDIWAFGCVFYEMLSGRKAFAGEDASLTLAAIMKSEPPLTTLPGATPDALRRIITCCLEKDPTKRLRDIGDLRVLEEGARPDTPKQATGWSRRLAWIAAGVVGGAIISAGILWPIRAPARTLDVNPIRFSIAAPPGVTLGHRRSGVAISPDSRTVVFAGSEGGGRRLYRRRFDSAEISAISGTEDAEAPFFSPDGDQVGFFAEGRILTVAAHRDVAPIPVASFTGRQRGATWTADGTIIFADGLPGAGGLWRIPASGGPPEQVANAPAGAVYEWPDVLPDGRTALVAVRPPDDEVHLAVLSLETGDAQTLTRGTFSRYLECRAGWRDSWLTVRCLRAVGFDADRLELTSSTPVPVVENVNTTTQGAANFALADNGTLVYVDVASAGVSRPARVLVWVDRQGREEPLSTPVENLSSPRVSPDGTRVAFGLVGPDRGSDIWIHDLVRGTETLFTTDLSNSRYPLWTPDGAGVVFASDRDGSPALFQKLVDTPGAAERLMTASPGRTVIQPLSWSADGQTLVYWEAGAAASDIGLLSMEGDRATELLLETAASESLPAVSPNGAWIAYESDETGQAEVYVQRFPTLGGKQTSRPTGEGSHSGHPMDVSCSIEHRQGDSWWCRC